MARRIAQVVSIVFVVAATAGCRASAPARFYTLASTASTDGAPAANYAVTVGPVPSTRTNRLREASLWVPLLSVARATNW